MGKTKLVPSLTYFTGEEYAARKLAAHKAGVSISNFNRAAMGYPAFKQGKPKGKIAQNQTPENSISFENPLGNEFLSSPIDAPGNAAQNFHEYTDERFQSPTGEAVAPEVPADNSAECSAKTLTDLLPTEDDLEDAFLNLMGHSGGEAVIDIIADELSIRHSVEPVSPENNETVEKTESETVPPVANLSQLNLFS